MLSTKSTLDFTVCGEEYIVSEQVNNEQSTRRTDGVVLDGGEPRAQPWAHFRVEKARLGGGDEADDERPVYLVSTVMSRSLAQDAPGFALRRHRVRLRASGTSDVTSENMAREAGPER